MPPIIAITSNTKIPTIMILNMVESRNFSDFGAEVVLVEFVELGMMGEMGEFVE